jgi:hypothetical protein
MRRGWALIAPNAVRLALSTFILVMKYLPPCEKQAVAATLDPTPQAAQRQDSAPKSR